ncbi:hypothetical protein [Streptomyces sp. NPDC002640]
MSYNQPPPYDPPPYGPPPHGGQPYGGQPYGARSWAPQPGVVPLRPLGVGDILKGSFLALGRSWPQLVGLYLLATVALAVVFLAPVLLVAAGEGESAGFGLVAVGPFWVMAAFVLVPAVALAAPLTALREAVLGRKVTWSVLWERLGSRSLRVLATVLLTACVALPFVAVIGLGVAGIAGGVHLEGGGGVALGLLGFLVLCAGFVGAVWTTYRLIFAPAVTVLEGLGPVAALRRSAALVKGDWWRIFGISYLMGMIGGGIGYLAMMLLALAGGLVLFPLFASASFGGADQGASLGIAAIVVVVVLGLVMSAVQALTFTLGIYSIGLLYVDQRIRRENFAEALLASAAPSPGPPAPDATLPL